MSKKAMITITPTGGIVKAEITKEPEIGVLQKIVGGYIELVPFFTTYEGSPCIAFCNEYGKLHGLEENPVATGLWSKSAGRALRDYLCGTVVIITGPTEFLRSL